MASRATDSSAEHVILSIGTDGSVEIDGVPCWTGGGDSQLLELLDQHVRSNSKHLVITPNVDQVLNIESSPAFRKTFRSASIRLLDGTPLVLLARSLGARDVRRYTGADLLPLVVDNAVQLGWRVVLAGGKYDSTLEAAKRLNTRAGSDVVSAVDIPVLDGLDDPRSEAVAEAIAEQHASIVFLGLGSPKQELWFERWADALPPGVYVGSGAAADFAAGHVRRAPVWLQRIGGEWLWRLAQEPTRLYRRYLIRGPKFLLVISRSHMTNFSSTLSRRSRHE